MVKEEIVAGLRQAISKKESIETAMTSFYNAGYSKEDIEEAASFLQAPQWAQNPAPQQPQQQAQKPQQYYPPAQPQPVPAPAPPVQPTPIQQPQPVQQPLVQQPPQYVYPPQPQPQQYYYPPQPTIKPLMQSSQGVVQRVSDYGKKSKRTGRAITITLFLLLLLLLGILGAVILYKDELANFFTNLFWRALF